MNIKKIGAIAAGTAMIGATLAGGAAASTHTYTDSDGTTIPENFFVKNGELNTKIVVGSQAAPADVKAASDIGLAIGNKLYTEEKITPEINTVTVKEDTTDDSYKIPVYSNVYDRPGNKIHMSNYTDYERSDLQGEPNWYKIADDPSISDGEDWTYDGDLENNGFSDDLYNVTGNSNLNYEFTMSNHVKSWDYEEEETVMLDAFLNVTIGADDGELQDEVYEDKDNGDEYPTDSLDLKITPEDLTVDFEGYANDTEIYGADDPIYGDLATDDEFDLLNTKYQVENVDKDAAVTGSANGEFTVAIDVAKKWGKTGDVLNFDGYKITVLDVDTESSKVLFELENPDGDSKTDTLNQNDEEDYWDGDVYVNATNVFAGIEGTNQAEFEVAQDKEDIDHGSTDWPADDWNVDDIEFGSRDVNDDGNDEDVVKSITLGYNGDSVSGTSVNVLDYFTIEYKYNEWTQDVDLNGDGTVSNDEEDLYAFESWIELMPPKTSKDHELEMGDSFGDVYTVEGATAADVMSKTLHPVTESMTMLDSEVDLENIDSNYILVGGPVANSVVEALVDAGVSEVNWEESEGSLEFVEYADYDHLIVAGQTRDETQAAAIDLMEQLGE